MLPLKDKPSGLKLPKPHLRKINLFQGLDGIPKLKLRKFSLPEGKNNTTRESGNIPRLKFKKINLTQGMENLRKFTENLTSRLISPPVRSETEDYEKVASVFLPDGAVFVKPKYPAESKSIETADLDGDSVNELIGTYSHDGRLHTMILKKAGTRWVRVTEIHHDRGDLNFRGVANLTDDQRLHLLSGISNNGKSDLYGYTLWNGNAEERFVRPYHRFELIKPSGKSSRNSSARLAIWEKDEDGVYDVKMHRYTNDRLEEEAASQQYWKNKVLPVYAVSVRRNPYSADGWYSLSKALYRAGFRNDAAMAVESGSLIDKDKTWSEKFNQLRKML